MNKVQLTRRQAPDPQSPVSPKSAVCEAFERRSAEQNEVGKEEMRTGRGKLVRNCVLVSTHFHLQMLSFCIHANETNVHCC